MVKRVSCLCVMLVVLFGCCSMVSAAGVKGSSAVSVSPTPVVAPAPVLTPAPVPAPVPVAPTSTVVKGWNLNAGLEGGAGALRVGYRFPFPKLDMNLSAGYALGKDYSVVIAQVDGMFKLADPYFTGLSVTWANYSEQVKNIPGISGNIAKGGNTGVGLFVGRSFNKYDVKLAYNTVLGITLDLGYQF